MMTTTTTTIYSNIHGRFGDYCAMVIDLSGPSLEDLFNFCDRKFSLLLTCSLAFEHLRVDSIHPGDDTTSPPERTMCHHHPLYFPRPPLIRSNSDHISASACSPRIPLGFLSRKSFSCIIFPGSDGSIQDAPTLIARPIEIPPLEKFQSLSPINTASAAEDPDSDASLSPAATLMEYGTLLRTFHTSLFVLSASKIEFETPPLPKAFTNSLARPRLPKMRQRSSILRPRNLKTMSRSASTLQRHLVFPVRGLQLLHLHDRRLPSLLHPHSRRPGCHAHDRISFLRLPSQRSNLRL